MKSTTPHFGNLDGIQIPRLFQTQNSINCHLAEEIFVSIQDLGTQRGSEISIQKNRELSFKIKMTNIYEKKSVKLIPFHESFFLLA